MTLAERLRALAVEYRPVMLDDAICDELLAIAAELERVAREEEVRGYESFARSVNEALNRGDGSYRP